jgi:probable glucitol transport protein GutA
MNDSVKVKVKAQSTLLERVLYGSYFLGQNIFFFLVLTFMLPFCTDVGVPVAAVGFILLGVRVFDAVNDPLFGIIVDKSKLKSGKFLPWLRVSLIGIPLFSLLFFLTPIDLPTGAKIAWAAVTYTLWSVSYTICDVPIFGVITAMTDDSHERTTLISIGRVFGMAGALTVMSTLPLIRQAIGGWFPTTLLLSVLGFILMAPFCFVVKERVPSPSGQNEVTVKALLNFVLKNKYLLIFYGAMILAYGGNIGGSLTMYIARYNLHDERLMAPLSVLIYIPSLFVGGLIPFVTKKIDKYYVLLGCAVASVIMGVVAHFVGYGNITLFMIFSFIRGIPFGGLMLFVFMFTPDFAEYGMYKTGVSAFGISFSIQTFTVKMIGAITGALAAAALGIIGFVEGEGAAQLPGFEDKVWVLLYLVPSAAILLSIPLFLQYKLRSKHIAIMTRCNKGEITHEEAEQLIGVKL